MRWDTRIRAFDWYHVRWPWMTFEGHFSLCCQSHISEIVYDTSTETEIANKKITQQLSGDTTVDDLADILRSLDFHIKFLVNGAYMSKVTRLVPFLMTLKDIWRSFQSRLFPCLFQQSLAGFRFARSLSDSWASHQNSFTTNKSFDEKLSKLLSYSPGNLQ